MQIELRKAVRETKEPLTLVMLVDRTVPSDTFFQLANLAREAGVKEALLASRPPIVPARTTVVR